MIRDIATRRESYQVGLAAYRRAIAALGFDCQTSELRIETQYESLCDWSPLHKLAQVRVWFEDKRRGCAMTVTDIPLRECRGWKMDETGGRFCRDDGAFFYIQGVRVAETSDREVGVRGWDQPIVTQVGYDGGILGLLRTRFEGIPHYLIEAKAEPGNYERVQMSPTLQATFANLERRHGGARPRFAEYFETPEELGGRVLYRQWVSEDGGRLYKKRNLAMLVEVPEEAVPIPPSSFLWMGLWQIKQCLLENAWVNPHVRGIIAHL